MTKRMLIDSTHAEETRVVVLDGNRLDAFDLETSTKHQLKGNIYLAKVVRVEPSLQAAFVEYGGNRHGFLAFGEIHPDYYQIPVADRKRLLEAQEQEAREDEEEEEREVAAGAEAEPANEPMPGETDPSSPDPDHQPVASLEEDAIPDPAQVVQPAAIAQDIIVAPEEAAAMFPEQGEHEGEQATPLGSGLDMAPETAEAAIEPAAPAAADSPAPEPTGLEPPGELAGDEPNGEPETGELETGETVDEVAEDADPPEQMGGENDAEEHPARRSAPRFLRNYKIQEVIRRRQIMLVQVVKEERGSKGAALTTYISLAGRFSVLMPNSPRGGGISRKITSAADRRRLKEVTAELDLPRGMGLIVRTAGANRPKPEILRDCEYLLNQWDQVRELTMKSVAPALIYEEASLIKRAIRDVYSRDVDDILVDGEQGWRAARDFMRMLMPTHARKVQLWKDPQPLFAKAQVEAQLEAMLASTVQLKSGGYLVINQTEALVAIDVNSGRSTRERGIEETALRTNLEAADEAARQLRLRDLAGLIVIDFIDMESRRNVGAVERRLKEALKHDRARIQVGPISHFGLLEMSRQRLRPSLMETNTILCPHCGGAGHVRSTESAALHVLRAVEEEGGKRRAAEIVVHCAGSIAFYILNHKRQRLAEVETRHAMQVTFVADDSLLPPLLRIERVRAQPASDLPPPIQQLAPPEPFEDPDEIETEADETRDEDTGDEEAAEAAPVGESAEEREQRRGRRRRRRRGGRREENGPAPAETAAPGSAEADASADTPAIADVEPDAAEPAPSEGDEGERRRRGRRGGRRRRREADGETPSPAADAADAADEEGEEEEAAAEPPPAVTYAGPTPADPFAGASAFDLFDAIEQAEEERAFAPRSTAMDAGPTELRNAEALQPEPEDSTPEPAVATQPVEPEPAQPEPEPPPLAPAIIPVLVGAEPAPAEKKRGWWRR